MSIAKGKWSAFVDSDDIIAENYLQVLLEVAVQENADLVMGGYELFTDSLPVAGDLNKNGGDIPKDKWLVETNPERIYAWFLERHRMPHSSRVPLQPVTRWTKLIKRDVLESLDWHSCDFNTGEDVPQMRQVYARVRKLVVLEQVVYYLRNDRNYNRLSDTTKILDPNKDSIGTLDFLVKQYCIDWGYLIENGYTETEGLLIWQEIFSYYWFAKLEPDGSRAALESATETHIRSRCKVALSSDDFKARMVMMGQEKQISDFISVVAAQGLSGYFYCRNLEIKASADKGSILTALSRRIKYLLKRIKQKQDAGG